MSKGKSILIADDHAVVREGLKALLEDEHEFTVVGEAATGLETIRLCNNLKPEILVLDIMLEDISGLEVVRRLRQKLPKMGIVILSMYGDKQHVLEALRVGVNAYVIKKSVASELVHAIREVLVGHRYLGSQLSDLVVEAYLEKHKTSLVDPYDSLSDREREVLHMVANGYTNAEIAENLYISRRTVETHRNNVMRKLNLNNQTDFIRYAIQKGIIPQDIS